MPKKEVSQAFLERELTLHSRYAQKAYDRIYNSASGSLYILGVVLRIIGSEEEAQKVEKLVDNMLLDVENELNAEIERLNKLLENNGLSDVHTSYTFPKVLSVPVTSPRGAKFLWFVEMLDTIAARLDCLWISGLLTDKQYTNASFQWQRRVIRLANKIRNITSRAVISAKGKDSETQSKVNKVVSEVGIDVHAEDISEYEKEHRHQENNDSIAKASV